MIPGWLKALANIGPLLLILSLGIAVMGIYRLWNNLKMGDKEEEERKRREFLRKMQSKIKNEANH